MKISTRWKLAALAPALMVLALSSWSCSKGDYSGEIESVTVAYSPFVDTVLIWIAEEQHFFSRNGIEITLRKYDLPVLAIDGMLKGEVDIVGNTTEFPLVTKALQKANLRTIGSFSRNASIWLVGRRDRGIEKVSDLKGKKVGTIPGTIFDFYLGRLLDLNGMNIKDVTLVNLKSLPGSAIAVINGDIDAAIADLPNANSARDRLGANAFIQPGHSGQPVYGLVVTTESWITKHPKTAERFLKSLAQAEEYFIRNPAEAKSLVQKRLNFDNAYMQISWPQFQLSLSLDQSLITAMEDEARWMIKNKLTTEKQIPDFMNHIYVDGLKTVKPEVVKIIR